MKKILFSAALMMLTTSSSYGQSQVSYIETLNRIQNKYWEGTFTVEGLEGKAGLSCTGDVHVYLFEKSTDETFAPGQVTVSYRHKIKNTNGKLCGPVNYFSPVRDRLPFIPDRHCDFPTKPSPVDAGKEVFYRTIVASKDGSKSFISAPLCIGSITQRPQVEIARLELTPDEQTLFLEIKPFRGVAKVRYELHRNDQKLEDFRSGKIPPENFNP